MNEEKRQMKNNNKMKIRTDMKIKNDNQHHKNLTRGSPKQSNIPGSFCIPIKKIDYRSVISITFISFIVFYMVAILTFNKDNG